MVTVCGQVTVPTTIKESNTQSNMHTHTKQTHHIVVVFLLQVFCYCPVYLNVFCFVLQLEKQQEKDQEENLKAPEFVKVKENLRRTSFHSTEEKEV